MEDAPYRIPLFDLDIGEEEIEAVEEVMRSKWLTMGDVTFRFEKAFAEFLDVPYCFALCNGTAALHLAIRALGIGPGDEVICPSLTFVASANAILYEGAKPIFADINGKQNFNISPASIEKRITDRTKAIMVVHYGGFPCDMKEILNIAKRYDLRVIEDAAHAPGAEFAWNSEEAGKIRVKKIGTIGDVGCFSFFSNKNISVGEGGMIATKNDEFAEMIKTIRSHGMTSLTLDRYRGHSYSYDVTDLGYNYRIDEIRSAIGLKQLEKLEKKNERRRTLYDLYCEKLGDIDGLEVPFADFRHRSSYHIFPVLLPKEKNRSQFMQTLHKKGIQTSIHYPPIHRFTYYQNSFNGTGERLEWTEYVGDREVTLPLYPSLKEEHISYIVSCVKHAIRD